MHPTHFTTVYVAKPDLLAELRQELGDSTTVMDNLVFSTISNPNACFALDVWLDAKIVPFESIGEAAQILKSAGRFWYHHPIENFRRALFISEKLRKLPDLTLRFPLPSLPEIGVFSLLDQNTLLYAAKRTKPVPLGRYEFIEDKINPPNRAYLKLWEALTLFGELPQPGESVVDLGSSPGGWTYVMQSLGAVVTSVDKAPLDPKIAKLKNVTHLQQSAFALEPDQFKQPVDWLLSDIACYPDRLYDLAMKWIDSGNAKRIIFTIKFQGDTDFDTLRKFQQVPNARVMHLFNNKHEATFFWRQD